MFTLNLGLYNSVLTLRVLGVEKPRSMNTFRRRKAHWGPVGCMVLFLNKDEAGWAPKAACQHEVRLEMAELGATAGILVGVKVGEQSGRG